LLEMQSGNWNTFWGRQSKGVDSSFLCFNSARKEPL
jgi:hypothetical protein